MLKKLLKYDFKAVFKYWWIAALVSFLLSLVGGGCITIFTSERELYPIIYVMAGSTFFFVIVGYIAFSILSAILVFTRFYKNFFTDEGYLTFTLPVKRSQLLNAKLILSTTTTFATGFVCVINILIMLLIGFKNEIFTQAYMHDISSSIHTIIQNTGWYLAIYIPEALIILVLSIIFSSLLLFFCITFAAMITKKAKVITAIGIYYGVNAIISFINQILQMFCSTFLTGLIDNRDYTAIALMLLAVLLFMAIFCVMLYTLEYWMIDRKLNLN